MAYETLGYKKKAMHDKSDVIRLTAYRKLGFNKHAFMDGCMLIREYALEYFEKCQDILGMDEVKYEFSDDEKELLRINGIPVFEK